MARRKRSTPIPGLSFSWRRATGVTKLKRDVARITGIPTTKNGRNAKAWRWLTGGGCLVEVLMFVALAALVAVVI